MSNFLKQHLLGIIVLALVTGVGGNCLYDFIKQATAKDGVASAVARPAEQQSPSALAKAVPPTKPYAPNPGEIDYRKLVSPAFQMQFKGKPVTVRATFVSVQNNVELYRLQGVKTAGRIFLEHREPLGSAPLSSIPFPMSVDSSKADIIYGLREGDQILISGDVEALPDKYSTGLPPIHFKARDVRKAPRFAGCP